ncbi:hypothetical protein LTR53_015652 [Teratosphaeriaceae sp. CCFEE 6253]|nr:hypothetical protein LTR53_015652 [Teratosphaeriaceae sp. CCFEE 6253]
MPSVARSQAYCCGAGRDVAVLRPTPQPSIHPSQTQGRHITTPLEYESALRMVHPFVEDDYDSVASGTTKDSEEDEDVIYDVDKVLAEESDFEDSGETRYLISWADYSIDRATWEPKDHIETVSVLKEWAERKRRLRRGEEKPFDLDAWIAIKETLAEEKLERARRRKLKRRRRGQPVSDSSDESSEDPTTDVAASSKRKRPPPVPYDSDDEELYTAASPPKSQKRVKAPIVRRKGVARVTSSARRFPSSSDEETVQPATQASVPDSDLNSLFDEGSQPICPDLDGTTASAAKANPTAPLMRPPISGPKRVQPQTPTPSTLSEKAKLPSRPVVNSAVGTAKRTNTKDNASKHAATKLRKQRARVNGDTPKDSDGPKFRSLAEQNRFQKYGRNEPAPDPSALAFLDPRSGKILPPLPKAAPAPMPLAISRSLDSSYSAYGRGRSPPRVERRRSVTPPTPEPVQAPPPEAPTERPVPPVSNVAPSGRIRTVVCWHWLRGQCRATAETCEYLHGGTEPMSVQPQSGAAPWAVDTLPSVPSTAMWAPPVVASGPSSETSCFYWLRGRCTKPPEQCDFAHRFTDSFPKLLIQYPDVLQRLTANKNTTCGDWAKTRCPHPDDQCMCAWAHHFTGTVSAPPPTHQGPPATSLRDQPPDPMSPVMTWSPSTGRSIALPSRAAGIAPQTATGTIDPTAGALVTEPPTLIRPSPSDPGKSSCFFWQQGSCNKPSGECVFAHYPTGVIANPPPGYRGPANVAPFLSTSPPFMKSVDFGQPAIGRPLHDAEHAATHLASAPSKAGPGGDRNVHFQLPTDQTPYAKDDVANGPGTLPAVLEVRSKVATGAVTLHAKLHVSSVSKVEQLSHPIQNGICLMLDRMVTAKDVQAYLPGLVENSVQWPAGLIVPLETSRSATDTLAEACKLHASGLVSMQDAFTLLIYPARDDEQWRFLGKPDLPHGLNAPLRFQYLPPMVGVNSKQIADGEAIPNSIRERASVLATRAILGIDAEKLLVERKGKKADTAVFLAWPQEHEAELQTWVKCFQDLNCKVYHSGTPDAWHYYRTTYKSFVILVHVDTPLWEIPTLYAMLQHGSTRVFSIGLQQSALQSIDEPAVYGCQRLLPMGRVIFITDDVFANHPEKASSVINQFLENNRVKPFGGENDKIAARPGVKEWLRLMAISRAAKQGGQDDRWLRLYYDICRLCPPDDEDPYNPPNPAPQSHLISAPPEELPSLAGLWEQDPQRATDSMVEWFVGWSVLNASRFRKFVVCHEPQSGAVVTDENGKAVYHVEPDPRGWARRWQHIGVLRPDQIVEPKGGK